MKDDVLERNLRLLIGRAYVPVLPRPRFREELIAALLAELDRRRAPRRSALPLVLAAAAAVLALLGGAWWLAGRDGPRTPLDRATLVARGEVALRAAGEGTWRAATADELDRGVDGFALAELATPREASLAARVEGGSLRVQPAARVAFDRGAPRLVAGALVARQAGDVPLRLTTDHGTVVLEAGRLRAAAPAAEGGAVELLLSEGRAHASLAAGEEPLAVGRPARLEPGGRLVPIDPGLADGGPTGDGRTAVAVDETAPGTPREGRAPADAGANSLSVVVRAAESGEPLPSGRLLLLREAKLNRPDQAAVQVFDRSGAATPAGGPVPWEAPIPDGRYFVYAHAEGYALAHLGAFTFGPGERHHALTADLVRGGEVRGFVTDEGTGAPIAGAYVVSDRDTPAWGLPLQVAPDLRPWSAAEATTANDGSFRLAHLSAGEHVLQITAPGHGPRWTHVTVGRDGAPSAPLELELGPGGEVSGRVTDENAQPIAGASVVVFASEGDARDLMAFAHAFTDAEGRYTCRDLPPGLLLVILLPDGGAGDEYPEVMPVEVVPGRTAVVDFLGHAAGTTLRGRIVRPDEKPFGVRNLGCFPRDELDFGDLWKASTSRADGSFEFIGLTPGIHVLYALDEKQNLTLVGEFEVPDVPVHEIELRLGAGLVEGQVVDGATDVPVPAIVLATRLEGRGPLFAGFAATDGAGHYALPDLPAGRYRVTAYPLSPGLGFEDVPEVDVTAEEPTPLDFWLWPGTEARVLVRAPDGAPVSGVAIDFLDEEDREFTFDRQPFTGADGAYLARGLRPGRYRVRARRSGWRTATQAFEARAGHPLELELVLQPEDLGESSRDEPARRGDR